MKQKGEILLVFPPFPDHLSEYPPLGIGQLASVLEENDIKVDILDLSIYKLEEWKKRLSKKMDEMQPGMVGISSLTSLFNISLEIAKLIKRRGPETKIIFGGAHPTACPSETLKHQEVDYVARGEAEYTLLELVRGDNVPKIKGLSFKTNGRIVHNPMRELIQDLDSLPFPARHLFEIEKYTWYPEMSLISSRGCPFGCYYCFRDIFGRKFRARSAENIVSEMGLLNKKYGTEKFYFYDDLFTLDKRRVIKFCEILLGMGEDWEWRCLTRVNTVDKELLTMMKGAGCTRIHLGIESGDPKLIKKIKGMTLEQAKDVVRIARRVGIETKCYFMIGHPWDTRETIENTIEFSKKINADVSQFAITTPFPGTELWNIAKDIGVIKGDKVDWDRLFMGGEDPKPIMRTYTLSSQQVLKLFKKARREWYLYKVLHSTPTEIMRIIQKRGIFQVGKVLFKKIVEAK